MCKLDFTGFYILIANELIHVIGVIQCHVDTTQLIIKFHYLYSIEIHAYQGTAYEDTTPLIDLYNNQRQFEVMMDILDFFSLTKYMPYGS